MELVRIDAKLINDKVIYQLSDFILNLALDEKYFGTNAFIIKTSGENLNKLRMLLTIILPCLDEKLFLLSHKKQGL